MPDRIENYLSDVRVNDGGQQRVVLPDFVDAGKSITRLGGEVADAAQPFLADHAEKQALEDAGKSRLVTDADGNYVYPSMPRGGGRIYAKAYEQAADQRYAVAVKQGYDLKLTEFSRNSKDDPQAFLAAATGWGEGVVKAAPAHMRGTIESYISNELTRRFQGLSDQATTRAHNNEVNAINAQMENGVTLAMKAAANALTPEDFTVAETTIKDALLGYDKLLALHEVSPEGAEAGKQGLMIKYGTKVEFGLSMSRLAGMGSIFTNGSSDELKALYRWSEGVEAGTPVGKIADLKAFNTYIPSSEVRTNIGQQALRSLNERDRAAAAALEAERYAAQTQNTQQIVDAVNANGAPQGYNYQGKPLQAVEFKYASEGGAADLFEPKGMSRTLGYVESLGILPRVAREALEARMDGPNYEQAMTVITNLRRIRTSDGVYRGEAEYQQLSARTKAKYEFDMHLRSAGFTQASDRLATVTAAFGKRQQNAQEVSNNFQSSKPEERYLARRNALIAKATGGNAARIPFQIGRTVDELMPPMLNAFPDDPVKALSMAVKSAASGWRIDKRFMTGLAPINFATKEYPTALLDAVIARSPQNTIGARIGAQPNQPYAKLEPPDDDPTAGFGRWTVRLFGASGAPAGSFFLDMDRATKAMDERMAEARQRRGQAALQAAKARRASGGEAVLRGVPEVNAVVREAGRASTPKKPVVEWGD